jgi:hypothetical protein
MSFTPVFAMTDHVQVGVRFGHDGMSALSPFYPQLRTLVDATGHGSFGGPAGAGGRMIEADGSQLGDCALTPTPRHSNA